MKASLDIPEKINHIDDVYIRCPDGTGVGITEGSTEGTGEGNMDGLKEGEGVGFALGIAVIKRVGTIDGIELGLELGRAVGEAVGASVVAITPNNWTSTRLTLPEYPPANAETTKVSISSLLESIMTSAVSGASYWDVTSSFTSTPELRRVIVSFASR